MNTKNCFIRSLLLFIIFPVCIPSYSQIDFERITIDSAGPVDPWLKDAGDLNKDNLPDLIVGGHAGGGLVWYRNPGNSGLEWKKFIIREGSGFSTEAETGDIDRDGIPDIVVLTDNAIAWYKNDGSPEDGGWKITMIEKRSLHDIEIGDYDKDGDIDIIARNQSEWAGNGNILHFYEQRTPSEWIHTERKCTHGEGLLLDDIDRDGLEDILAGNRWYKNPGKMEGQRWREHIISKSWSHGNVFIATGDMNHDGRKDIVLSPSEREFNIYRISWFEHPHNPRHEWKEHIIDNNVQCTCHFVGCGDFDLDGNQDVITAEMVQSDDPDEVKIYRNKGKGKSWTKILLWNGGSHSCRVFDCDGDGDLDFFGANHIGSEVDLWINHALKQQE